MPELPEVETIARKLNAPLTGRMIHSTRLLWSRTLATPSPEEFTARLPGQVIRQVTRRAKYLHVMLSGGHLFFHLRMSGDMTICPPDYQPAKHDRLLLEFSDGAWLAFNDTRKFGRVWLVDDPADVIGNLGPEPFDPALTAATFGDMLHTRKRQIKPLLLDQTFIAGIGNIYSDEALHLAGVHPLTQSDKILKEQSASLLSAIRTVLETGIKHNGASIDWVYRGGGFQNYFRVYGRENEPCPICNTTIKRIVVGQRGTHFCPACQPFRE
jgi:formamidopyrimidine-DNA glycosylase